MSTRAQPSWLDSGIRVALALCAVAGLVTLGWTCALRVGSPFPLEWMEGASLQHALRLLHGEALYGPPSADFVPYLYPPLAYCPVALSAALFGASLPAARTVSLLCVASSLLVLGRAGARLAAHPLGGFVAAGMFAIGFGYSGAFLDLVRVDACFVLLLVLAAERALADRPRSALALLALSAFAKQHGLLLLLGALLGWLARDGLLRRGRELIITCVATLAIGAGLELASSGYFGRYVLGLPLGHALARRLLVSFFFVDLGVYLPVLSLGAALELRHATRERLPVVVLFVSALLASALGRAHTGGFDNVRLPAFALLCLLGTAPLCRTALDAGAHAGTRLASTFALMLQLALLWQPPSYHRARDADGFRQLQTAIANCARGGQGVALDYALLTEVPFVHTMALSDVRDGRDRALARAATRALTERLGSPARPAAIAVGETFPELERALAANYRVCARLRAPRVATGYRPGAFSEGRLWQVVYAQRDAGGDARGPRPDTSTPVLTPH